MRPGQGGALLDLYDEALPQVYGYLLHRCGHRTLAEDLAAETFLAAVQALADRPTTSPTTGWLIGIARHKLVDHWRRAERERRGLRDVASEAAEPATDQWETHLDRMLARQVLAALGPHHRAALTLRYLDGLPVAQVADHLDRTLHATEALLVRARAAFRRGYQDVGGRDD